MATEPRLAYLDVSFAAYIEDQEILYHEVVFDEECRYFFNLEADEEDAELEFFVTDTEGEIVFHQDDLQDPDEDDGFMPESHGIYYLCVRSKAGATDYLLSIEEED